MTWPAPSRRYMCAMVLPATRGAGHIATCACGNSFSTHPGLALARSYAHVYAVKCPLARLRADKYEAMKRALA